MRRMPPIWSTMRGMRVSSATAACVALAMVTGCASTLPVTNAPSPSATTSLLSLDAAEAWGAINEEEATPLVQVRDFEWARTVSVLGFFKENSTYGLRAEVRHDGQLVSSRRLGDHRLYINRAVVTANGGFRLASIMSSELLLVAGRMRDPNACILGRPCSPHESITLGIPDSVLRNNRDGLVVTFDRVAPSQWTIALSSEMIAAYLNSVDSVIAMRRKN